ncbi:unnamed protein product [Staurois parvus]|uniref:RING-type E3 ubiquitin transferase n=1 Tax=Staurois parvus TaxID=386267 RepID=A0ABN9DMW7_9NEOB|nr:unnamed protein product [Staurois parvus]
MTWPGPASSTWAPGTGWVQCFSCGGILRSWEPGDRADTEHRKYFPTCPFLRGRRAQQRPPPRGTRHRGRTYPQPDPPTARRAAGRARRLPELLDLTSRMGTFRNWPLHTGLSPEQLATAGFFYTGQRDNVRCFHCDGELRNWERGDDPWREHAKWFPRCEFLMQSMGHAYVRSVQDTIGSSPESSVSNMCINTMKPGLRMS